MKQTKRLDLWVRTGAGQDLFPGESSGYNSSASSATGDQSPSSADHKRLSIVKEETLDLEDRYVYDVIFQIFCIINIFMYLQIE